MTKKEWINAKVKRIMAEGVRKNTHKPVSSSNRRRPVSPFQAAAIAHSMYGKKKKVAKKDGYKRVVDNKMRALGDTDYEKKLIRVNKKKSKKEGKGEVLDTIVHEETHRKHPKMHEKNVRTHTKMEIKKMSKKQKAEYRKWFK